eukprot:gene1674-1772_t
MSLPQVEQQYRALKRFREENSNLSISDADLEHATSDHKRQKLSVNDSRDVNDVSDESADSDEFASSDGEDSSNLSSNEESSMGSSTESEPEDDYDFLLKEKIATFEFEMVQNRLKNESLRSKFSHFLANQPLYQLLKKYNIPLQIVDNPEFHQVLNAVRLAGDDYSPSSSSLIRDNFFYIHLSSSSSFPLTHTTL